MKSIRKHHPRLLVSFELWQSHWQSFTEKPVLGWGLEGIRVSQTQQWLAQEISDFIYEFKSHAHNQFLHALATRDYWLCCNIIVIFRAWVLFLATHKKQSQSSNLLQCQYWAYHHVIG